MSLVKYILLLLLYFKLLSVSCHAPLHLLYKIVSTHFFSAAGTNEDILMHDTFP